MDVGILILVALALAILFVRCVREPVRDLEEQVGFSAQPEISDSEYCELIPNVDPEIALKVREVCAEVSGWDQDEIHPDTRIVEFELW